MIVATETKNTEKSWVPASLAQVTWRARNFAQTAQQRFLARRTAVVAAAAVLGVYAIAGYLSLAAAAIAAGLIFAVSVIIPTLQEGGLGRYGLGPPVGDASSPPVRTLDAETWRGVVDAIPDAAMVLDISGTIRHHNTLVADLFPKVRNGQPISHALRNPQLLEAVDHSWDGREPIVVELLERVPVERRVSATVSPLIRADATGQRSQPALLITFRDLSEQDKLAQMRADFITNASHELRTPLASLKGFVETLQGPARNDEVARNRFLGLMASQAARMTRLIDDLLSLSRVEMRVHLPPRGLVDLNEVAHYVEQTLEPLAEASSTEVRLERLDTPARIRGDRDEIVQVLQNLVHNAINYGREGGQIRLRVVRETAQRGKAAQVAVEVVDDGPGIAPEHLPRLTERFYRANVASSRAKGGTGLGLAIVKHIVNRHRGDLRITSRIGHGSTFAVIFDELPGAAAATLDRDNL